MLRVLFSRVLRGKTPLFATAENLQLQLKCLGVASPKFNSTSTATQQQTSQNQDSSKRDPEKVKRAKLYDILIVSSIGVIGFGYLLVRRVFSTPAQAKGIDTTSNMGKDGVEGDLVSDVRVEQEDGSEVKKKRRKKCKENKVV